MLKKMLKKILLVIISVFFFSIFVNLILDVENDLHLFFIIVYSFLIGTKVSDIDGDNISLNIKSLIIDSMKLIVLNNSNLK